MSEPCSHCGGTKTDPVPKTRTLVYFWARHLGYEIRQCGRCRRLRWLDPEDFRNHAEQNGPIEADPAPHARATAATGAIDELPHRAAATAAAVVENSPQPESSPVSGARRQSGSCPKCGSSVYRRSRRRLLERLFLRGPMARCKECECRFPLPTGRHSIQDSAHA